MSVASRRRREREERRERILEAARLVFRKKGFSAATMDEVAAEAQLSKGTLYLYFASKDDLFLAMSACKLDLVVERFGELEAASVERTGLDYLAALLSGYAEVALEDPDMFRVAILWLSSTDPVDTGSPAFVAHRERVSRIIAAIVGAVARGQADGSVRADLEPMQLAAQLWGGMIGTVLVRANAEELTRRFAHPVEFERLVPGFIEILCNGVASPCAGAGEKPR